MVSQNQPFPAHIKELVDKPGVKEALRKIPNLYRKIAIEPLVADFAKRGRHGVVNAEAMEVDMLGCMKAIIENRMEYFTVEPPGGASRTQRGGPMMWDHAQAGFKVTLPWLGWDPKVKPILVTLQKFCLSNVVVEGEGGDDEDEEGDEEWEDMEDDEEEDEEWEDVEEDEEEEEDQVTTMAGRATTSRKFPPAGDYQLFIHVSNKKFPKTPAKSPEKWEKEVQRRFLPNTCGFGELPSLKGVGGFIFHSASGRNVGYLQGAEITRRGNWYEDCDDASQELADVVCELFDFPGPGKLQSEHRKVWGSTMDKGKILHIESIEITPEHRGKGALASVARELISFMQENRMSALTMLPGSKNRPKIPGRATDGGSFPIDDQPEGLGETTSAKLMEGYAKQWGCLQIGEEGFVAMVPDVGHRCWDVANSVAAVSDASTKNQ